MSAAFKQCPCGRHRQHVLFHVSRHTCATLLLTFGADLYTVSELLGHCDVKTSEIYAKAVDEKKRQAVDWVPKI
ncbi:MAG: tyrosine-type recombinase/integrase [Alistipes sp.]|nr:tyrosine-type recombinase/integrase [Alistipes sp.]